MLKTLTSLSEQGRLRIPLQVIKEFSANRPKELIQRINDLEVIISGLQAQKPLNEKVPILEGKDTYESTTKLQTQFNSALKDYRKGLIELRDELKELFYKDTYLEKLQEVVINSFFSPDEQKVVEELVKEAEKRFKNKIPPGYKDNPKEDNSAGDYIIWDSILHLNEDVIFISGDKKADWVYKDKQGNPISARRELVQEFYEKTNGKDFAYLSPKEFITLMNPDVSEAVKEDLSLNITSYNEEKKIPFKLKYKRRVGEILFKYDPMSVILNEKMQYDEYETEAEMIFNVFAQVKNIEELHIEIKRIFENMFEEPFIKNDTNIEMLKELWSVRIDYLLMKALMREN